MASINFESIPVGFSFVNDLDRVPGQTEVVIIAIGIKSCGLAGLSSQEKMRACSMGSQEARDRFVAGRSVIRQTIAPWLGIEPSAVDLALGLSGKPFVKQDPALHFSISHSGEMLLAAFSRSQIGVDLERERDLDAGALARRFFSREESRYFANPENREHFFRFWTCREAAIKADGRGMGTLLASTRVILPAEPDASAATSSGTLGVVIGSELWNAYPWRLRGGHHAALAIKQRPALIHWRDLR